MKTTLSTNQATHLLLQDQYASWSYEGAFAICEYLEQVEEDTGEAIEFDPVAIRCDFSEYKSIREAYAEYFEESDLLDPETGEFDDDSALETLRYHTTVIEFEGGIIVQAF